MKSSYCALVAALAVTPAIAQPTPGVPLAENFDGVTPPALPYGWTSDTASGVASWIVDSTSAYSAPNSAHVSVDNGIHVDVDVRLVSNPFVVETAGANLWFHHVHDFALEPGSAPQGNKQPVTHGYLDLSIEGGEFQEILAAGGSFLEGGYVNGWIGANANYPNYSDVVVQLPPSAAGKAVVLRWRMMATPAPEVSGGDWWVDSVQVCDGYPCYAVALPNRLDVDTTGNGVLEPVEITTIDPSYLNSGTGSLDLTAIVEDVAGPPGTTSTISDSSANYGTIEPGAVGACASTPDCYAFGVDDGGTRPMQHWDEQFREFLSVGELEVVWAVHVGGSFDDVPASNPFYPYAETVLHRRITGGCGGTSYCPDSPALRKQMAVFLLKSKYGGAYVPPPAVGLFADVPVSDPFAPWIENLYNLGITGGCSTTPLSYCPDQTVLRKQMAVFLLKTLNGSSYVPPGCQGIFPDVACPSPFADWIEALYQQQIAAGCGNGAFCPDSPNTRGQMSVFLTKTFGLTLYGP